MTAEIWGHYLKNILLPELEALGQQLGADPIIVLDRASYWGGTATRDVDVIKVMKYLCYKSGVEVVYLPRRSPRCGALQFTHR